MPGPLQPARGSAPDLLSQTEWSCIRREHDLSRRQLQILQQIFRGKKLPAIAEDLNLSIGTVKTYCQRMYQKLQVHDQRELAVAILEGLLHRGGRRRVPGPPEPGA